MAPLRRLGVAPETDRRRVIVRFRQVAAGYPFLVRQSRQIAGQSEGVESPVADEDDIAPVSQGLQGFEHHALAVRHFLSQCMLYLDKVKPGT